MPFAKSASAMTPTPPGRSQNTVKQRLASYQARLVLPLAIVIFYPMIAFLAPTNGRAEFYPFFAWHLFAKTSSHKADVVLLVHEIEGVRLDGPTLFFELRDDFAAARGQNIQLAKLLDDYVFAMARGDSEMKASLNEVIENTYLRDRANVRYDVAIIYYHPIERYTDGTITDIRTVASNQKGML